MCSKPSELDREERGGIGQGGKEGNCVPRFWQESQQMCSRQSELWRKEGQLPSQILARIAANVLKAIGTSEERGAIAPPNFERNCSKCAQSCWNQVGRKEAELGRKGGQLCTQILAGIAANVLKVVGTMEERGAIALPTFGKNCSKCAQGRWNQRGKGDNCFPKF